VSAWLTITLATVIALLPDVVLTVVENLAEKRLFFKLEQKYLIQKKIANQIIAVFNFIKHRTISHNYVNENVELQNVPPSMQQTKNILEEIRLDRLDSVLEEHTIQPVEESEGNERKSEEVVSVFM
jgi:hypothetical protein